MKKYIKSTISKLKGRFSAIGLISLGNWFYALAYLGNSINYACVPFERLFKRLKYIFIPGGMMIYCYNSDVHQDIVTLCQCIIDVVTILSQ